MVVPQPYEASSPICRRLSRGSFRRLCFHEFPDDVPQAVDLVLPRDVALGAACVLDVFLPAQHLPGCCPAPLPPGCHMFTAKISESRRGLSSSTASTGVLK